MKRLLLFLLASFLIYPAIISQKTNSSGLKLWYENPANAWEEALPIGNGRLGAMIFGGLENDHLQFNEETLWTGTPHDYAHQGAYKYLEQIRELLWMGKQKEAEDLALEKFMSVPLKQEKYQPFGDLWICFPKKSTISGYRRELDLSKAECLTTFSSNDTVYNRKYLASYPDNLIAVNLSTNKKKALSFDVILTAIHEGASVMATEDGMIELKVKVKNGALHGTAVAQVKIKGGTLTVLGNKLHIQKADEATILLTAATNFVSPTDVSGDPEAKCFAIYTNLAGKTFTAIEKDHFTDYQKYFNRFFIYLGSSENENLPTDRRIKEVPVKMDNSLAALYVQYGRYLMLASSREGTYPANLQGVWNDKLNPAWDSKFTVNINTEMNYWPVEMLNIAECHTALFKMIEEVVPSGEKVAKEHYNARGWVLHHNTDLWRGAAPINASNHGIWVSGSGWLAHDFWEHYLYSQDVNFLSNTAWPVMKGAALFYSDFLVKDPKTGYLVSCPSNSPENGGLVSGPTMDHEIIRSLFKACILASEILGRDKDFADTLRAKVNRIAPYHVGKWGQLQEWMDDIDDPNNKHRHVSHLWAIYPGKEINRDENPDLMKAAKVSLVARGDEGTGWSLAWKINFWARLLDGNHSWSLVQMLLRPQGEGAAKATGGGSTGGGSYPNLFDAHPPFQIDGNFGGSAGIVEMLMQSHLGSIDILPALPDEIPSGHIKGIRARGGFELEFAWSKGQLVSVRVLSTAGTLLHIRYADKSYTSPTKAGEVISLDGQLARIKK
jgi:alpha-L-fucosidase 2